MLIIEIKVVTQSGRSTIILDKSGILKCFVKSAPENGKANQEVIEIISKVIKIAKGYVEIVSGFTSRKKIIKIQTDINYEKFINIIGSGIQKKIV